MDWEVIHTYSRADALRDGVLIDITDIAKHFGFKYPIAITGNLFNSYINPNEDLIAHGENVKTRVELVLAVLFYAIKGTKEKKSMTRIHFEVEFLMDAIEEKYTTIELIADCGPGDNMEPVITIMLPEDD